MVATLIGYAATCALLATAARDARAALTAGAPPVDPVVSIAAAGAGWLVLTWLVLAWLLALAAAARAAAGRRPGAVGRLAVRLSPRVMRQLAALSLGVGLAGGVVSTPAQALPVAAGVTVAASSAVAGPDPDRTDLARALADWTPDRPAAPPPTRAAPSRLETRVLATSHPEQAVAEADEVVVRRGDSLWAIAARHLGPGASAAAIAAEWPRWYAANRDVIGPDPDHLLPGRLLRPPR